MAVRYEDIRDQVLHAGGRNGPALGWALFVRKGMAAWLEAWRDSALRKEREPAPRRGARVLANQEQQSEIVTVWTGMVLSHVSEGIG